MSEKIAKCNSWDEKISIVVSYMPENPVLSPMEVTDLLKSIFKKLMSIETYDHKSLPLLVSPITLFKPTEVTLKSASEDYGLKEVNQMLSHFKTSIIWHFTKKIINKYHEMY